MILSQSLKDNKEISDTAREGLCLPITATLSGYIIITLICFLSYV